MPFERIEHKKWVKFTFILFAELRAWQLLTHQHSEPKSFIWRLFLIN